MVLIIKPSFFILPPFLLSIFPSLQYLFLPKSMIFQLFLDKAVQDMTKLHKELNYQNFLHTIPTKNSVFFNTTSTVTAPTNHDNIFP